MFLLSVNYYDDYHFHDAPSNFNTPESQTAYYDNTKLPKGLNTGTWRRILQPGPTMGETRYDLFDDKARSIYNYKKNHLGGFTSVEFLYHFDGRPFRKTTTHSLSGGTPVTASEDYEYKASGLMNKVTHAVNSSISNEVVFDYDALGQNIKKNINEEGTAVQQVDFSYNIRGWLTGINDIDDLQPSVSSPADLFAFKINYYDEDVNNPNEPLYNGNISTTSWKSFSDNIHRQYLYEYDGLNRLLNATFYKQHQQYNSYNEQLSYDKNGNIQTILRKGGVEDINYNITIDDLAFTYDDHSNLLRKVIDLSNNPQGFDERTDTGSNGVTDTNDDYTYDDFGNMISDANKGILQITYNHLHLPVAVSIHSNIPSVPIGGLYPPPTVVEGEISYIYNADGVKVGKTVERPQVASEEVAYQDGFQYKDEKLQFFPHPEGYVNIAQAKQQNLKYYSYVYQYRDHLGNNRVTYTKDPTEGTIKILFEDHYYPFGLKHRNYNVTKRELIFENGGLQIADVSMEKHKYKYNGMEWQDELSLNWYDYQARNYDPALGRWMNIDPLAENSRRYSPYAYALNNPVFYIDPDGMEAQATNGMDALDSENEWIDNGDGTYTAEAGDSAATLARDAGITEDRAREIMANTYKSNSEGNNMGTYTDSDGVEKSKVDVGDTVLIPEQVNAIVEETKSNQAGKNQVLAKNAEIDKKIKEINSIVDSLLSDNQLQNIQISNAQQGLRNIEMQNNLDRNGSMGDKISSGAVGAISGGAILKSRLSRQNRRGE